MAKITYTMYQEKQTKNKVVYKNLDGAVDTMYVDKAQLRNHLEGNNSYPATITVSFDWE